MSASLSPEASDALSLIRELRLLDETGVRILQQLFANRLNEELVQTVVLGKELMLSSALFKVVTTTHSATVLGYVLRFTADLCQIAPSVAKVFATADYNADVVLRFLEIASAHARIGGIHNPAVFLAVSALRYVQSPNEAQIAALQRFLEQVHETFESSMSVENLEYVVHSLSIVLRRREFRKYVLAAQVVPQIPKILVNACNGESAVVAQLTYETLLCVWLLCFDYGCMAELHRHKVIPTVHRVLQRAQKEKVIRMALMVMTSFCAAQKKYYHATTTGEWVDGSIYLLGANRDKAPNFFVDLIGVGVMKTLWQLARRKFGDDDITAFVNELTETLDQNMDAVTSFSEYRGEVLSGVLEWSPVHTSTKFWKENVGKFEDNSYEVLRELGALVQGTKSDLTLAVACHDIGEVVRHHRTGRALLSLPQCHGLKERIMGLMAHPNPEVSKHALVAVQKIMVQKWEFIQ